MAGIVYPGTTTYTYRTQQAPPQDLQEHSLHQGGERLRDKAIEVEDFFRAADNTELDLNDEEGQVRLRRVDAHGLLEDDMDKISGTWVEDDYLHATAYDSNSGAQSYISVSEVENQRNVFNDRASHFNNRYLPTVESLTENPDGSFTYAVAYDPDRQV